MSSNFNSNTVLSGHPANPDIVVEDWDDTPQADIMDLIDIDQLSAKLGVLTVESSVGDTRTKPPVIAEERKGKVPQIQRPVALTGGDATDVLCMEVDDQITMDDSTGDDTSSSNFFSQSPPISITPAGHIGLDLFVLHKLHKFLAANATQTDETKHEIFNNLMDGFEGVYGMSPEEAATMIKVAGAETVECINEQANVKNRKVWGTYVETVSRL